MDFIDKPMKKWLQIATDDVDAHCVIGEGDARAVATSNTVPLFVPCALTVVVVEVVVMTGQGLGPNWERTPRTNPSRLRDTRHPWRAQTWTWTRSSCRSSAAWAPRTRTSSFRSFRGCLAFSSTQPAAPSSWTWPTGECGDTWAWCRTVTWR